MLVAVLQPVKPKIPYTVGPDALGPYIWGSVVDGTLIDTLVDGW